MSGCQKRPCPACSAECGAAPIGGALHRGVHYVRYAAVSMRGGGVLCALRGVDLLFDDGLAGTSPALDHLGDCLLYTSDAADE